MAPAHASPSRGNLPPVVDGRTRTMAHTMPAPRSQLPKGRSWQASATVSTGLMRAWESGNVGHSLPTTPGLSKQFDLDGLKTSNSPSLLRPLLTSIADWHDDDKALYGGSAARNRVSGYDSEVEFSPSKRQHTVPSIEEGSKSTWAAESDTRLSWPQRGNPLTSPLPVARLSAHLLGEDGDGRILHQEFRDRLASARQCTTNPIARFEPSEGGIGGDASSTRSGDSGNGHAIALDFEVVSSKIERVIEERGSARIFPESLQERYEYFLQISGTAAWSQLNDEHLGAKSMPFDIVEEQQVYTDMLEKAISMVEARIPGCGAVLRSSFEWFVQVPIDKVMLARRDHWRRPHRDAFNVLENKVEALSRDAKDAQEAATGAAEMRQVALTQVKESSDRANTAEKARNILEVELRTTTKAAANRLQEATVAQAISLRQASEMINVRSDYEKTLKELANEQRKRKYSDEAREKLEARCEKLEADVTDYIRRLKGTRAAKRAQKIQMRNKIVLSHVQKYDDKHKSFQNALEKEGERVTEGIGLVGKLDRAMTGAQQEDRKIAQEPGSGGATVNGEASVLAKYAQVSDDFAQQAVATTQDHDVCIGDLEKLLEGFNMADQLPDSDSDGEAAEIEQLKKDNDFLREKQFNNEQLLETRSRELVQRQEMIVRLENSLRIYGDWQKRVEMEVTRIKEEADRKVRSLEEEIEKIKVTLQELKMREQGFKDQIRQLEKDVAARDKEISQFESKLAQFKHKVETLEKENQAKAQKISQLEQKIEDMKAEIQNLKDENKSMQSQIKELNHKVHDLEVELAVERETVAKLHAEVEELKRQIKLHEERAREHMAEMKRVKEEAEKAAEEARLREQKLLRENKELEDKIAAITREFKAKLAQAEKQAAEALAKQQVAEEKYSTLQKKFDELSTKYESASKDISRWRGIADEANGKIDSFKKSADDAAKKLEDASEFVNRYDEFQKEMDRLKDFETEYLRARREADDVKQEMEALTANGGFNNGAGLAVDDDLLAGMGAKSRGDNRSKIGSRASSRRKLKTYEVSIGALLGPWVCRNVKRAGTEDQDEVTGKLLMVRMLNNIGERGSDDISIAGRMADFMRVADHQFKRAGGSGGMDEETASHTMQSMGLRKDYIAQALEVVTKKSGPWLDKNAFADAVSVAQSLAAWHKIDVDRKGQMSTASVITFLEGCGYSAEDSKEFIHRADPDQTGNVTQENWVAEWGKHLGASMDVQPALPASTVAQVTAIGVSSSKMFRTAGNDIVFARTKPQAGTQTQDNSADPSVAGGGFTGLQPTPMGRILEMKDQQIAKAETNYEAAVDQIAQLLAFIKTRADHHDSQVQHLRTELQILGYRSPQVSRGTSTPGHGLDGTAQLQQLPGVEGIGDTFPQFSDMYPRGSELSVQVKHARTKLGDLLKEFNTSTGAPPAPRSIVWLSKMLHGILASKMVSDAVDMSMHLPMSSYAAFCADWMRNRFGVEALVRKACIQLQDSLRCHREHSLLVEILADFFEGKYGFAEQRAFLHCYSLVGDVMDRQRQPRDSPHPREISVAAAMDIVNKVLPYATDYDIQRLKDTLLSISSLDYSGADVDEGNSDNIMVDDHNLYMLILKERVNVQKNFHSSIVRSFRRQDMHGRGVLTYEEMSRMMSSLVPWNDPQQLHNIITNICPEFLTPGAVIDIKNVLILDERIDFIGCKVNSFKKAVDA